MKRFSFPKKVRLCTTNQFSLVLRNPRIVGFTSYVKVYGKYNNKNYPRLGIIIPKKQVQKSHDRNRIKRLIRESFRKNRYKILYMDFVIIIIEKRIIKTKNQCLSLNLNKLWFFLS